MTDTHGETHVVMQIGDMVEVRLTNGEQWTARLEGTIDLFGYMALMFRFPQAKFPTQDFYVPFGHIVYLSVKPKGEPSERQPKLRVVQ